MHFLHQWKHNTQTSNNNNYVAKEFQLVPGESVKIIFLDAPVLFFIN